MSTRKVVTCDSCGKNEEYPAGFEQPYLPKGWTHLGLDAFPRHRDTGENTPVTGVLDVCPVCARRVSYVLFPSEHTKQAPQVGPGHVLRSPAGGE